MATYPGAVRSFTTKMDYTDTVFALHINDLQDEVRAVQNTLGVNPHTTGNTASTVAGRIATLEGNRSLTTHTHAFGTNTPAAVGKTAAVGVSEQPSRADHAHAVGVLPGCNVMTFGQPTVAHNTLYTVTFDTVVWNHDNNWVAGTPTRITCKTAGLYLCFFNVVIGMAASANFVFAGLYKNGGIEPTIADSAPSTGVGNAYRGRGVPLWLNVNDYFELRVQQMSGVGATLLSMGSMPMAGIQFMSYAV